MFVKILDKILLIFFSFLIIFFQVKNALSEEVYLHFPEELLMIEFDKHILPRFKFKTQISIKSKKTSENTDLSIDVKNEGISVFSDLNGIVYKIEKITSDEIKLNKIEKFIDWLRSPSGISAIEGFQFNGTPMFKALKFEKQNEKEFVFEGDIKNGLLVSQKHCKRCHVVDDNAFAGIDSSPSFHAMRSFEDWEERFRAFWTVSPHLNVISIKEVYDAGSKLSPVVIVPIELSLDDIDDILSYVSKIKPKDLGKPINFW
tara:strand:+ start:3694 stop:4470 length:777 start_codon:yes stop_codon:yes gene_type:complete